MGSEVINMVIPLSNKSIELNRGPQTYVAEDCTMKCTSAWGCNECTQTIIERCKSQTCSCTSGTGGCSSKISFP